MISSPLTRARTHVQADAAQTPPEVDPRADEIGRGLRQPTERFVGLQSLEDEKSVVAIALGLLGRLE